VFKITIEPKVVCEMKMDQTTPDATADRHAPDGTATSEPVSAKLCQVLATGVDVHRCLAAQALGKIGHPNSVETLIAALLDEDEDVRTDAAAALVDRASPAAGKQLFENLLGDPCSGVKLNAIDALVRLRDSDVVPWLRRLLKGRDEEIAWDEVAFYHDEWDDWADIQVKAIEALSQLGDQDAVADIVEAVNDEFGQDLTEVGFKAFGQLGEPGAKALASYLEDGDERQRRRVAVVLASMDTEAAQAAIERALRDSSMAVRLAAARTLAARSPTDQRLSALFQDVEPEVRAEAVRLCGRGHPQSVQAALNDEAPVVCGAVLDLLLELPDLLPPEAIGEAVKALIDSPDAKLAARAAMFLAVVSPETAADELVALLQDTQRPADLRVGAVKGLRNMGGEQVAQAYAEVVGDDERRIRLESIAALAALAADEGQWPNAPADILLAALRGELVAVPEAEGETETEAEADSGDEPQSSADEEQAQAPAEDISQEASDENDLEAADDRQDVLADEPEPEAEPVVPTSTLESILGDNIPRDFVEKAGQGVELTQEDIDRLALAGRGPKKKVVTLDGQVAPHQDVRQFAARVLGDLARDEVAGELAEALNDKDTKLRLAAADSLACIAASKGSLPAEAIDALLATFRDPERDLRLSAIRALGALGDEKSTKILIAQLRDEDSFVRVEAVRALAEAGKVGPDVEALVLDDDDPQVRLEAAGAVAAAGGAGAVEILADFTFAYQGHHRRQAGRILRRLDSAAANSRLLEVLDDPERKIVWAVAIEALEEVNRTDILGGDAAIASVQQEGTKIS
jgi:HEAT repeat protein